MVEEEQKMAISGTTVIMSNEYIDELTRHRDNVQRKLNIETLMGERIRLEQELAVKQRKLDEALDFQDTVEEVLNVDCPRLTVVKTLSGMVLPLRHVQVI